MADETKTTDMNEADAATTAGDTGKIEIESPIAEVELDARDVEIAILQDEVAALKDRLLRAAADMENLRKRAEREKAEATLYAGTNFARDLLSVADNMARALTTIPPEAREAADDVTKNLLSGVEMVERELLNVFQRHGIRRLKTVGEKFDPNMHQALFEQPSNDWPPGTVVQEMQAGYAIGERCLRPAMVGVAKAQSGEFSGG